MAFFGLEIRWFNWRCIRRLCKSTHSHTTSRKADDDIVNFKIKALNTTSNQMINLRLLTRETGRRSEKSKPISLKSSSQQQSTHTQQLAAQSSTKKKGNIYGDFFPLSRKTLRIRTAKKSRLIVEWFTSFLFDQLRATSSQPLSWLLHRWWDSRDIRIIKKIILGFSHCDSRIEIRSLLHFRALCLHLLISQRKDETTKINFSLFTVRV